MCKICHKRTHILTCLVFISCNLLDYILVISVNNAKMMYLVAHEKYTFFLSVTMLFIFQSNIAIDI